MRRDDERGARGARFLEEERGDLALEGRVEVAGRLVGEDEVGPRHERAGDRDALALAVRELVDRAALLAAEPDAREERARAVAGGGVEAKVAVEAEREKDILEGVERGDEFEGLEDLPRLAGAYLAARRVARGAEFDAAAADLAERSPRSVLLPEPDGPRTTSDAPASTVSAGTRRTKPVARRKTSAVVEMGAGGASRSARARVSAGGVGGSCAGTRAG